MIVVQASQLERVATKIQARSGAAVPNVAINVIHDDAHVDS